MATKKRDYYEVLEISRYADVESIKKAYRRLVYVLYIACAAHTTQKKAYPLNGSFQKYTPHGVGEFGSNTIHASMERQKGKLYALGDAKRVK